MWAMSTVLDMFMKGGWDFEAKLEWTSRRLDDSLMARGRF